MATELSIFDRPTVASQELRDAWDKKGWPEDLFDRALELRIPSGALWEWLGQHDDAQLLHRFLDWRERLLYGTLHVREATWSDDEALADLYANSPEDIGDWEVTVERGPMPFAQFRLQEHANLQVLDDRGVILAASAHSGRNTIVQGQRVSTHIASAFRVRKECRGQGMSNLLRMGSGPGCAWFGTVSYWYIRSGNDSSVEWMKSLRPDLSSLDQESGLPVTVSRFRARPFEGDASGIRNAERSDSKACVSLINRTHRGLDFFRPYTEEFLHSHLDDPFWGPKPVFWGEVYTWGDYFVLEEAGRIIACAGLWDRGRNVREVWQHRETDERHVIEPTALLDWGYAKGREDAMVRLIGFLIGRTHELGRTELMAPLDQSPALLDSLASFEPSGETRRMLIDVFDSLKEPLVIKAIERPYTDLAYW